MSTNHITRIAIVGGGGQLGRYITQALVSEGKHTITALTRAGSKTKIPAGVHEIKEVDYESHTSLVAALRGQQALIIVMARVAAGTAQKQLIDAAQDAGVQWIMPNEYGFEVTTAHPQLGVDTRVGARMVPIRDMITKAGMNWVGLCCSFWYEFSLAGNEARYGFNFHEKTLTLFDDGTVKIPTTTWTQAGRAAARLFALPVQSDGASASLSDFKNRPVYVDSFFVSQRDMLASVLRVTGEKESDWTITSESSKERYDRGVEMMDKGNLEGYVRLMYTRIFFPDGASDYTARLNNKDLGLQEESLDEATKTAVEMAKISRNDWAVRWD